MESRENPTLSPDVTLDVGDTLCGELALLLRAKLSQMEPGQVIQVVARDSAAPQDIPGWCEVTGHALVRCEHPNYWIRRKDA